MNRLMKVTVFFAQFRQSLSDFLYAGFDKTTGLVFNGAASPTACEGEELSNAMRESSNKMSYDDAHFGLTQYYGHTATTDVFTTIKTVSEDTHSSNDNVTARYAIFGHRAEFEADEQVVPVGCTSKLRLTPSHPSKAGSVWYDSRVPVVTGFETIFSWQITDQSIECTEHVDRHFSRELHKSCAIHGGDGFAFVIHGDPVGSSALGGDGEHLGYGGISNSLAIEFDTWTNVDTQQSDDVFEDHISIHSSGPSLPNSSNETSSLGYWRAYTIADGKVHSAKIQYLPYVETRYSELMTANENLIPYLKDNGEGRRLGTLAVFVDQGIIEDRPLFAIPVNLSLLLHLPDSLAYVGFTASTGRKWQKNDIKHWEWCNSERCKKGSK